MKKPRKRVYRIRTNETESDLLQARALAAGMKPTAYIRSQLFPKKIVATKPKLTPEVIDHLNKVASTIVEIEENVATKPKVKSYKTPAAAKKDFKPNPETVKKAEASYRRFAEPGALLKK